MQKNVLKKWEPLTGCFVNLHLENLHQNDEGLLVLHLYFKHDYEKEFYIKFDYHLSHKHIYESYFLYWSFVYEEESLKRGNTFIVDNSDYLEWFHQTSQGICEGENLIHYGIYTENDCIDIISGAPPKAEWIIR